LPLARACATLREAVAAGQTQGELAPKEWPAAELRSLKGKGRRHVGRSPVHEQGEAIVRGQPLYAADVRRPGQLYGRVLRATASPELPSTLAGAEEAAARVVPGFVAVVRDPLLQHGNAGGLGIVARTPDALDRIEAALAARWEVQGTFDQVQIDEAIDIDRRLAAGAGRAKTLHDDRVDADAPWDVDLRIDVPLAAHAAIEPRAAVAEFGADGSLQIWVGTQDLFYQRDVLARRLGLNEQRIVVHGRRVGGAFGGKTLCTVELEAALLARAVQAPVKVQWTRAQEFQHGFHRPPSSHRIRVRLRQGQIDEWWHAFASSHIIFTSAGFPPWLQRLADIAGDPGVARGADLPYRARARRIGFDAVRLPVHTGPWRGLGAGPNVLAIECAIDECARAAGSETLAFRLAHAEDPRLARVLERVAAAARWSAPPAAPVDAGKLRGRGLACGIYKAMSYAAVIAEIEVDTTTATVKLMRLWCAHECGRVVNPDQVRAQCEGNLVWGLGMVLVEHLPVAQGQVAAATFADSPIPRFGEVTSMHIELVNAGEPPSGAGETAIVAAGAAIANALRDACGLRLQRLPLQQAELRAALGQRKAHRGGAARAASPTLTAA
jgi:isoquinoline 1-oxidoreductase beta subunit